MPRFRVDSLEAQLQKLRDWSRDHAGELRSLDERVRQMEKRVENLGRQLNAIARKDEVAEAVADKLSQRSLLRWTWWQRLLAVVALVPAYVGMLIVLGKLIAEIAN